MARRRTRRRKQSYEQTGSQGSDAAQPHLVMEELSPRARRLVEGDVIDLAVIAGSGPGGRITSGDILHAARVMEVQQSVARIESVQPAAEAPTPPAPITELDELGDETELEPVVAATNQDPIPAAEQLEAVTHPWVSDSDAIELPETQSVVEEPGGDAESSDDRAGQALDATGSSEDSDDPAPAPAPDLDPDPDSATSTAVAVGGQPIATEHDPWEAYNGSSEGFSERARVGADQSWGEAEAHLAAMAEEASSQNEPVEGSMAADMAEPLIDAVPASPELTSAELDELAPDPGYAELIPPSPTSGEGVGTADLGAPYPEVESDTEVPAATAPSDQPEPALQPVGSAGAAPTEPEPATEVMMDFGTLELVDPESVWTEGAEDFAPWFLAHSRQLGDVLGLEAGLSDARQFTTKSATGVVGRDDSGEDVVVVSSQNAVADDSDLGRALGMAASSGAASVALVSAALHEDQLKALAWLNNQTKSGVKWYGIEMRVVRIADSPAAMLFDLVASPPE